LNSAEIKDVPDFLPSGNLFCFGLGYSSLALAKRLVSQGWDISGTVRKEQDVSITKNISVFPFDPSHSTTDISDAIFRATHLLITIPPQPSGDVVLKNFSEEISKAQHLQWIGYISSTGVYGDTQGEWVDESSPLLASTDRNRQRIEVESAWLEIGRSHGLPVMIFRCVGIYGPGRNLLASIRQGRARRIDKPGLVFSRIHSEDLAQTLEASMKKVQPGEVYNVSDDCPSPPAQAVQYACDLLGVDPPPLESYEKADLSPIARGFYITNKRISNKKIKQELGVKLRYPDYRCGLKSLLKDF
jgi:nucleoside-diphosphate-sugar epimerase